MARLEKEKLNGRRKNYVTKKELKDQLAASEAQVQMMSNRNAVLESELATLRARSTTTAVPAGDEQANSQESESVRSTTFLLPTQVVAKVSFEEQYDTEELFRLDLAALPPTNAKKRKENQAKPKPSGEPTILSQRPRRNITKKSRY